MIDGLIDNPNTVTEAVRSAQTNKNMSTREKAYNILQQLNEIQLQGFVSMFGIYFAGNEKEEISEKKKALSELNGMLHPINDIDYEKELASYRNERYGV